jgi:hypothetical protein
MMIIDSPSCYYSVLQLVKFVELQMKSIHMLFIILLTQHSKVKFSNFLKIDLKMLLANVMHTFAVTA